MINLEHCVSLITRKESSITGHLFQKETNKKPSEAELKSFSPVKDGAIGTFRKGNNCN